MPLLSKIFILLAVICSLGFGDNKTVKLTSLEWPPYTSESMHEKGLLVFIAKKAFDTMGYKLEVDFFPWKRAVMLAQNSDDYDGYFPEYFSDKLKNAFIVSDSMGKSPLGLIERIDNPILWEDIDDLKKYKLGVVQGYINTIEFDDYVARGIIKTEGVIYDSVNIKKVAGGRIDGAVIDRLVFEYMMSSDPSLGELRTIVSFNKKLLDDKSLHICFKKSPRGEVLNKIFNEGLQNIDIENLTEDYLNTLKG